MEKRVQYSIITALVLLNAYTLMKLNRTEDYVRTMSQHYQSNLGMVESKINSIYSNVEERLKKQASILDNHEIKFGEFNAVSLKLPITVSITPKEMSDSLTAALQLKDKNIPMKKEGTSFEITTEVNIFEDFQPKAVLEDRGVKKIETLEEYLNIKDKYILNIYGGFNGLTQESSGEYKYDGTINFNFAAAQGNKAEKVTIVKEVNGTIIEEKEVMALNYEVANYKGSIKLSSSDKFTLYSNIVDSYGLKYKYIVMSITPGSEGKPINEMPGDGMQMVTEIRDKNDNLLFSAKDGFIK